MRFAAILLSIFAFLMPAAPAGADAAHDFAAAVAAVKKGKRDEAMRLVTKAIDSKEASGRDLAHMHYMRAELYSQAGKLEESIADYTKTIEIVPDHAAAYHDRAVVYALQKKYAEALDDLSRAEFLVPKSPLPHFNRGRVYESMGKKAEAIAAYRKARALAPRMKEPQDALRRLGAR
jgi:tetratricopeptide (TPR) repeat protein